ncbi:MAG: sensor histidine kinase [Janthinobacterium lividum]
MPLRWTKSLRFQLSVWSLATTAAILLIASILCYSLVRNALQHETDQALHDASATMLHHMAPADSPDPGEAPDACHPDVVVRKARLSSVNLTGIGSDALCLRLVRTDTGQTAAIAPILREKPEIQAVLASLPALPHLPVFAGTNDDDQLRCLTVAVPQSSYVMQVAVPWDPAEDLLTKILTSLILASLLFLMLSGIGSGLLVGHALRPIDHIVTEAETLTPDRLDSAQLSPRTLSDTEIGHLIAALNRMLTRISTSFSAQRQFTADASHELRTPLTILRGQFELALTRERSAAEYRSTLESGLEEVLRMARIVESLAYLTRGDAASPSIHFLPLSLAALTVEVSDVLAGRASEKNLRLIVETDTEAVVSGDSDALRRMVQNLIENALAYTPPGGTVTVSVTEAPQQCKLSVSDTGVGIAESDLPHLFNRFFRADPSRANTGGSGLGLSIVQSIVKSHGGEITVWSEPGKGSRFTIILPH